MGNNEVEMRFKPRPCAGHANAELLKEGTPVLLIGVRYSDPRLRPGFTEDEFVAGEKYDRDVLMCRFFMPHAKKIVDVPIEELKSFVARQNVTNARIKVSRPFMITMLDGGKFDDLPVIGISGNAVTHDYVVVNREAPDKNLLITGDGEHLIVSDAELQEYKRDDRIKFYNF